MPLPQMLPPEEQGGKRHFQGTEGENARGNASGEGSPWQPAMQGSQDEELKLGN